MQEREGECGREVSSLDGRTFQVDDLDGPAVAGDLVILHPETGRRVLGQVLRKRRTADATVGEGGILGVLGEDGELDTSLVDPFAGGWVQQAPHDVWAALERSRAARMRIGVSQSGPAMLSGASFNRHTFLCGQSGSGKSYALGVLIEQLLIDTDLPIVVLDPNGDFVGLGTTVEGAEPDERRRIEEADVQVFGATPLPGARLLRVRFNDLGTEAKAAVLQLDPLVDRGEYNLLISLATEFRSDATDAVIARLHASDRPDEKKLAQRIENLGVLGWDVWARDKEPILAALDPLPRATVVDVGGFQHPRERLAVAMAILDDLWARREQRQPVLLVIDEAHNVCPADPVDPMARATTDRLVQIANEGRKYGIWLFLCTQRPSRISQSVLAQCDNLALMRMNSPGDLAELEQLFGFVPPEMLRLAPMFRKGESLMSGAFAPAPTFVQVRTRRTQEGGGDLRVPTPAR
ncbi:ATP-binding protein [Marmoricola sp. URHB0036]|uniref:ATP-binding protein n=1 Tax=Marmoricola sp. URHB0036 TaxID=1298863 RepID=UPI0003F4ED62|nr:ATP-binding protein [Marmoricola sp. URHB0036]